jgi:hypothetical protein
MSTYRLFVPKQAAAADVIYFDMFVPTTSQFHIQLLSVRPAASGAVAVTGVIAVDMFLQRTSAVGTGGTAATFGGTSNTAMTFNGHETTQIARVTDFSGRLTPTGGATNAGVLGWASVFAEETNAGTYAAQAVDLARPLPDLPPIAIPRGTGFRVVQGSEAATVGNFGFNVIFKLVQAGQL